MIYYYIRFTLLPHLINQAGNRRKIQQIHITSSSVYLGRKYLTQHKTPQLIHLALGRHRHAVLLP
jgi:hypothetical protein